MLRAFLQEKLERGREANERMIDQNPLRASFKMTTGKGKYWFLIIILLITALLATYKIKDQGTYDEDALEYYTAARTDIAVAKWIIHGKDYSLHDYLEEKRIYPRANIYGKPLYHLLSIMSLLIMGDHDYSLQIMNALFGVMTILMLFKIGERLYGTNAGLYAAVFCMLSPLFLWLSRTNMAHMPQLFFFFTGMYFYLKSFGEETANIKLVTAGIFMALSMLTHPSANTFIGLFFVFDFYVFVFLRKKYLLSVKRALLFALPMIVLVVATNSALNMFKASMGLEGLKEYISGIYMNYFEQFKFNSDASVGYTDVGGIPMGHFTTLGTSALKTKLLDTVKSYFYDPWIYEGTLRIVIMLSALVYLIKDFRTKSSLFLLILIAVPYLLFVIPISNPSIRTILTIFPLLAIASGQLIDRVVSASSNRAVTACLLVLFLIYSAFNITPIYSAYTGFRNVADWLKAQGVRSILTPAIHMQVDPYMDIYGVRTVVLTDPEKIREHRDIKYTVIAMRNSFFDPLKDDEHLKFARNVVENRKPLIKESHIPSLTAMDMYRREHSFAVNMIIKYLLGKDFRRSPIDIYVYRTEDLIN